MSKQDLFYALFHVKPWHDSTKDTLDGAIGAYISTFARANSKTHFFAMIHHWFKQDELYILETEDYASYCKNMTAKSLYENFNPDCIDVIKDLETDDITMIRHLYMSDDDE